MTDTHDDLAQNRGAAHYPEPVASDLTTEQLSALKRAREAQAEYLRAKEAAREAMLARNAALRAAWDDLHDLGATRVAREIGNISEGRVRGIAEAARTGS